MKKNPKKQSGVKGDERPVFDSIRKPVAPPGHPLSQARPEERAHPAERKIKHKRPPLESDRDGDA